MAASDERCGSGWGGRAAMDWEGEQRRQCMGWASGGDSGSGGWATVGGQQEESGDDNYDEPRAVAASMTARDNQDERTRVTYSIKINNI